MPLSISRMKRLFTGVDTLALSLSLSAEVQLDLHRFEYFIRPFLALTDVAECGCLIPSSCHTNKGFRCLVRKAAVLGMAKGRRSSEAADWSSVRAALAHHNSASCSSRESSTASSASISGAICPHHPLSLRDMIQGMQGLRAYKLQAQYRPLASV